MQTPPESEITQRKKQQRGDLQIAKRSFTAKPDIEGDDEADDRSNGDIGIRKLDRLELIEKQRIASRPRHAVRGDDQEVIAEQWQAANEISGPEVKDPINK